MKLHKRTVIIFIAFGIILLFSLMIALIKPLGTKKVVGGRCTYTDYAGTAVITKVEMTEKSKRQANVSGGAGYEGYEIWFSFKPDNEIKSAFARVFRPNNYVELTIKDDGISPAEQVFIIIFWSPLKAFLEG